MPRAPSSSSSPSFSSDSSSAASASSGASSSDSDSSSDSGGPGYDFDSSSGSDSNPNSSTRTAANALSPAPDFVPFALDVTSPTACAPIIITFAPLGTPPYHLVVALTNQYTYQIELPSDYAPLDHGLWTYNWTVPEIRDNTTSLIVSLTDASGLMANSSRIQMVLSPDPLPSCQIPTAPADFAFWSDGAPLQCEKWEVGFSGSKTTTDTLNDNVFNAQAMPPFTLFYYPEQSPPISYEVPMSAWNSTSLEGSISVLLPMRASTAFIYSMSDAGRYGQGGVSQFNVIGSSENDEHAWECLSGINPGFGNHIPRPSVTVTPKHAQGLPERYVTTTYSYKHSGSTSSPIAAIQTVVEGNPLPGFQWGSPGNLLSGHSGSHSGLKGGQVAGIVVAAVGCAILLAISLLWSRHVARKRRRNGGVTSWDLPSSDADKQASDIYASAPITHGIFTGRTRYFPAASDTTSTDVLTLPDQEGMSRTATSIASTQLDAAHPPTLALRPQVSHHSSVHSPLAETLDTPSSVQHAAPGSSTQAYTSTLGGNPAPVASTHLRSRTGSTPPETELVPLDRRSSTTPANNRGSYLRDYDSDTASLGVPMSNVSSGTTQIRIRQHLDAGVVLMDDNERGEVVDLPPQYESLTSYASQSYSASQAYTYPTSFCYGGSGPADTYNDGYLGTVPLGQPPVIAPAHPLPVPRNDSGRAEGRSEGAEGQVPGQAGQSGSEWDSMQSRTIVSRLDPGSNSNANSPISPPSPTSTPLPSHPITSSNSRSPSITVPPSTAASHPLADPLPAQPETLPHPTQLDSSPTQDQPEPSVRPQQLERQASEPEEEEESVWLDRAPTPPPMPSQRRYFAFLGEGQELGPNDSLESNWFTRRPSATSSAWTAETAETAETGPSR